MASKTLTALVKHNVADGRVFSKQSPTLSVEVTPAVADDGTGEFGFYRWGWGSDAALQQRRVTQEYVGTLVTKDSSTMPVANKIYSITGNSNGFAWSISNKAGTYVGSPGGPVIVGLLNSTQIVYGDGTSMSYSINLNIDITARTDGVDYKSVTLVIKNLTTGKDHTFTFAKGVSYGTGGTYHQATAEFRALASKISAIGTYGDLVRVQSVIVEPAIPVTVMKGYLVEGSPFSGVAINAGTYTMGNEEVTLSGMLVQTAYYNTASGMASIGNFTKTLPSSLDVYPTIDITLETPTGETVSITFTRGALLNGNMSNPAWGYYALKPDTATDPGIKYRDFCIAHVGKEVTVTFKFNN